MMNKFKITVLALLCLLLTAGSLFAQNTFPTKHWQQYASVEEAGFSKEKIKLVEQKFESSKAAALLVIANGKVLISKGDNTRRFMAHSIRKSFMNALIGIEIANGTLKIDHRLDQLGIDDIGKLSAQEKTATLMDLLSSRSGIYHSAAYSPKGMKENLPKRGSHLPGTFWYYNNWDFNTLLTIYEKKSGKQFFEAFKNEIAVPIGMEDFRMQDTYYRKETDKSIHPAYLFRMSARDMARFGLLYLRKGNWAENQLVPAQWVEKSTDVVSKDLGAFSNMGSYGLLWWISKDIRGRKMFYASGSGGHRVMVFPDDDLVIVHRVNSYEGVHVGEQEIIELATAIIDARKNKGALKPTLQPYDPPEEILANTYTGSMDAFLGTYRHRFLGQMTIKKDAQGYLLQNGVGIFRLYSKTKNSFYPEDIESLIVMEKASEERKKFTIATKFADDKSISEIVFYY